MNVVHRLKCVLLFIIWGILFFVQNLACFDVFGLGLWYFYVVAVACAGLEFFLIRKFIANDRITAIVCCLIYGLGIIEKTIGLVGSLFDPLTMVCFVLNITGLLLVLFLRRKKSHS